MPSPVTPELVFPLSSYRVSGTPFGKRKTYQGKDWGIHLGEDVNAPAGTDVWAAGNGSVVYAALHEGTREKGNWGHIVIIRHQPPEGSEPFYSLYGHLGKIFKRIGDSTVAGEPLGFVGEAFTPENGFWEAHLHFAVYVGPWFERVLPGYFLKEQKLTELKWWRPPSTFVRLYAKKKGTERAY